MDLSKLFNAMDFEHIKAQTRRDLLLLLVYCHLSKNVEKEFAKFDLDQKEIFDWIRFFESLE